MRRFRGVLVWLLLSACQSPTAPTYSLSQEFTLAPGKSAGIADTPIRIRFAGVFGDSRCPADAVCIQGGDAIVRIAVLTPGSPAQMHDLHTGDMEPVRDDVFTIALVQLVPYPFSSHPIAPSEYRATLVVRR